MNPKILSHFKKVDPKLYKLIKSLEELQNLPAFKTEEYFMDLVESIVSQQLSGKAADTIFGRFKALFPKGKVTPQSVLKLEDEKIRDAGLSYAKIKYIKDLATKVVSGQVDLGKLKDLADEEVIVELVKVKGIGKWTAEMFLMFTLGRPDVFSHGDLGLNTAIKRIYGLKSYDVRSAEKIVSKWSPYKSTASRILWKSLNNR